MERYKIELDKSFSGHVQKKWLCPSCNKKRFVRFYNYESNEYLDDKYGRCDREDSCGYFFSPFQDKDARVLPERFDTSDIPVAPIKLNYVDSKIVESTLNVYEQNNFVKFLEERIGFNEAMSLVFRFYIGTAKNNGTIFWQIDQYMRCRTGQKIHYNVDGHRRKDIDPQRLFKVQDDYKPCLFGEHQIFTAPKNALFAIVESEKTAVFGAAYMPTLGLRPLIWLASSGSNGLTSEKIQPLRGRDILLIPDFSFSARAMWGLVPMRKMKVDNRLVIHPDGEVQEDYESAKMRLENIECRVKFFDPHPEIIDGSDIADIFVQEQLGQNYELPDLSQFDLSPSHTPPRPSANIFDYNSLTGQSRAFRLLGTTQDDLKIECGFPAAKEAIEKMFKKNPSLLDLFLKFDICNGTLEPMNETHG